MGPRITRIYTDLGLKETIPLIHAHCLFDRAEQSEGSREIFQFSLLVTWCSVLERYSTRNDGIVSMPNSPPKSLIRDN